MSHICPWRRELLEWDGLCSHPSTLDPVSGDFGLTEDQLAAKALDSKLKAKKYDLDRHYQLMAENHEEYTKIKVANATKSAQKSLKLKRFYCSDCDRAFPSNHALEEHFESEFHKRKLTGDYKAWCEVCNIGITTKKGYKVHLRSDRHKKKATMLASEQSRSVCGREARKDEHHGWSGCCGCVDDMKHFDET